MINILYANTSRQLLEKINTENIQKESIINILNVNGQFLCYYEDKDE